MNNEPSEELVSAVTAIATYEAISMHRPPSERDMLLGGFMASLDPMLRATVMAHQSTKLEIITKLPEIARALKKSTDAVAAAPRN